MPSGKPPTAAKIIAYDFETSRIAPGTPDARYLTAYAPGVIHLSTEVRDTTHLHALIVNNFLNGNLLGYKFVAWAGNSFDTYFIATALVLDDNYILRPYLTRNGSLRGLAVIRAKDAEKARPRKWEFLDGIAMLGLVGVKLEKFLNNFAPDHKKMTGVIDFEKEEFDSTNPRHCEYAMQDSVGLWHGVTNAQAILLRHFNEPVRVTMGGACIRIFKSHIPEGKVIEPMHFDLQRIVRDYVLRGGFCFCVRKYSGAVWKYDLNQAYAAAMRDAKLPAGHGYRMSGGLSPLAKVYAARVTATNPRNRVPFYYRTEISGRLRSVFAEREIRDTWLTNIEIEQLKREGWKITVSESWWFDDSFSMRGYVKELEKLRMSCDGGPSGPIGTMVKMVGNHSYGKTLEQTDRLEYVIAPQSPEGFAPYYPEGEADPLPFVHFRFIPLAEHQAKDYHMPQIGAWITAHVRMVVRRAALLNPDAWLYADTDCVVFSADVTEKLDIHPSKYGAWKIEDAGAEYRIIAKKVYFDVAKSEGHAKGLNVKRLLPSDFEQWFEGLPPEQVQTQRNNFLSVMRGAEMYRAQLRHGTGWTEVKRALAKNLRNTRSKVAAPV